MRRRGLVKSLVHASLESGRLRIQRIPPGMYVVIMEAMLLSYCKDVSQVSKNSPVIC